MDTHSFTRWLRLAPLAFALPLLAAAAPAQLTENLEAEVWFDSALAAARAAGQQYYRRSAQCDCEFMGAVLEVAQPVGEPRYRYIAWQGHAGEDQITIQVGLRQGERLAAIWHTHGAPHWSRRYFSTQDTQLVAELGVPLYLATPEGELRVFRPGDRTLSASRSRRLGLDGWGFAAGARLGGLTVAG